MTPYGLTIGTRLEPKRGKRVNPVTVRMVHRADHACSVTTDDGARAVLKWADIRKNYRADA